MRRFSVPLLTRVLVALAVVALVPFAITHFLVNRSERAIVNQTQKTHLAKAQAAAGRVQAFLELHTTIAQTAAGNPTLYRDPTSPAAADFLRGLLAASGDIMAAGTFALDASGSQLVLLAQRTQEKAQVAQALRVDDARTLVATTLDGRPWVRLRVGTPDERLFLHLVIHTQSLAASFVTTELGDEAELILADQDGQVLAGNAKLADFPPALLAKAASHHVQSGADEYFGPSGELLVSAYADVVGSPWFVLSRQPSRVAAQATAQMRRTAWQAFAAVVVLVGLLGLQAQTTIVRPLRRLIAAQRRLAGGEVVPAQGGEIEQLEQAFAQLESNLNDREALSRVFLGRYQVVEVLGVGAMGTVFRGFDPKLLRPVALKTIKISQLVTGEKRKSLAEHLLKEAITLARLQHPNIVTVFDVLDQGEAAFLAMELVEGMSLETYRFQEKRLPAAQVVPLGAAVVRGLSAAHQHGVVHHDVKPANILLGYNGAIKVADFGIADLLTRANQVRDTIFGTPGYVAPEALQGKGYQEKSDLFAVGVVLYECLVGARPFQGKNPKETMLRTVIGDYLPLRTYCPDVLPELAALLDRLLARKLEDRPPDAVSVAEQLEHLAAQHGWRFIPPKLPPPTQEKSRETIPRAHASLLDTHSLDRI